MSKHNNLAFELVSVPGQGAGGMRTVARFFCNACNRTASTPVKSGAALDAEHIAKRLARATGWEAHPFQRSKVYCPKCAGPPKKKNDTDSEFRKVMLMPPPIAIKPPVEVKQPTADQRAAIRNHLDKSFDDSTGMYLDGMDDGRIAELVGVPRVVVEEIRERAYGPIRVDPALGPLRTELNDLKARVATLIRHGNELEAQIRTVASRIEKVLAGMAT